MEIDDQSLLYAKNHAWREVAEIDSALDAGRIDESGWFDAMHKLITPTYLAADNPRGQSGHSGDEAQWRVAREFVCDAFDRDGAFLDIGCLNGHLMESVHGWAGDRGQKVEPFGLDISPELAELARRRLPAWSDRIWQGNALTWKPPRRFTYVRTGLEYVPQARRTDLLRHLLDHVTETRLIGPANEEADRSEIEAGIVTAGLVEGGRAERPHRDPRLVRRIIWGRFACTIPNYRVWQPRASPRLPRARQHRLLAHLASTPGVILKPVLRRRCGRGPSVRRWALPRQPTSGCSTAPYTLAAVSRLQSTRRPPGASEPTSSKTT
jgi:hypothetical protein